MLWIDASHTGTTADHCLTQRITDRHAAPLAHFIRAERAIPVCVVRPGPAFDALGFADQLYHTHTHTQIVGYLWLLTSSVQFKAQQTQSCTQGLIMFHHSVSFN